MERINYRTSFEKTLRQCQEIIEKFEGSEETLRHIQRVEASLKRLVATAD
ncbi:MAG: hypothetical protein OEX76_00545 [Candidatus Bathyarchaeota archaeon]|nr:hypothetical protein [Candidatus Bathyarchaeota archaeon]MDH5712595.1 hypothetical protein [Candidatus Bathyarchaeota archaeon]